MDIAKECRTIALIPARSGSKRIIGKNSRMLAGKPLIQWTIEAAKLAKGIDEIVVSSNDPIIRQISLEQNVKFLERPESLCRDDSKISEVIGHFIRNFPSYQTLILLQPTSPLRSVGFIEKTLDEMYKFKDQDDIAIVSVSELPAPLEWLFVKPGDSLFLKPLLEFGELQVQQTTKVYSFNGSVYCASIAGLKESNYVFGKMRVSPLLQDSSDVLDIDVEEDFIEAERIMKLRNS